MARRLTLVLIVLLGVALVAPAGAGGGRNRTVGSEITITATRGPVTVDGNLQEWDETQAKFLSLYQGSAGEGKGAFDDCNAQLALQYDAEALYLAVWWSDPTPLGPQTSPGLLPPGDGLILTVPGTPVRHVALWRTPGGTATHALLAAGATPLAQGKPPADVTQGYRLTGKSSYTQEVRLPWAALGGAPAPGAPLRLGVELCFGGLDPAAGYKQWVRDVAATGYSGSRWGGYMGWGMMDGWRDLSLADLPYDPAAGALVTLAPAGTPAPANPPMMHLGSERTRVTQMVAVPLAKLTLDGKLTEWDPASGTTIAYEPTTFPGRYACTVHWGYTAEGLAVGLRWQTGGPQLNVNDPRTVDHGYDGGDALQVRLGTDKVSQIDTWYHTASQTPAMHITYGAKFNEGQVPDALAKGAQLALQPTPGGGYTEELFFPWALITQTGAPLQTGDSFRVILDLFWSGLDGNRLPFIINAKLAQPSGVVTLPFVAPRDGFYTVVVENAQGQVVRRLLDCLKVGEGQTVADWDGLDDEGVPAAAGAYHFRGLHHTGLDLKYLMTLANPGTPPWQNEDGTGEWGGDHGPPQTVAADDWGVYLGWPSAEDGNGFIGCDFTGKKRWGFFQTPAAGAAGGTGLLASDGQFLYFANELVRQPQKDEKGLAYFTTVISCLDRTTGQRRGFSLSKPYQEITKHDTSQVAVNWTWHLWQRKNYSWDTYALHDDYFFSGHCAGGNLAGLAARGGKLYVSLRVENVIAVYNSADMAPLARWPLPVPAGLAWGPQGELYAASGASVVRVDLATGAYTPVVKVGLEAPVALAVAADGALYVADWGAAQCVKVFEAGKLARTVGLPGGRPWVGAYNPNGMLLPRGLAIDQEGKLWVAEDDNYPRRVSVWEARTGKFLKEFLGGTPYGGVAGGLIDPHDPSRALAFGMLYAVDLTKEGYRPLATMWRRTAKEAYFGLGLSQASNAPATKYVDGPGDRRYLATSVDQAVVIGQLLPDGAWRPCAAVGSVFNRRDNPQVLKESELLWRHEPHPAALDGHGGDNYIWTDLNGDGLVQADEMQWRKQTPDFPLLGAYWGPGGVDKDFNVILGGDAIVRFPLQGWATDGTPRYDINQATVVVAKPTPMRAMTVTPAGVALGLTPGEASRWQKEPPVLAAYAPDGHPLWQYRTTVDYRPMGSLTGEAFLGPVAVKGGEAGEVFGLTQWHGCYVPFLTVDGLYIGRVLRDPAEGGAPGPDMYRGETIQYLNRLDDGRVILAHGKNAHHFLQVTGLDTVQRFAGAITLTPAQATLAAARLQAAQEAQTQTAPIRLTRRNATPPVTPDGKLDEWDWSTAASIGPRPGQPRAEVALSLQDNLLCVAFKVFKGRPFLNTGQDPTQLFLTGDAADLQFALDPVADPQRTAPVIGDTRLLFSKLGDQPVAMLYRAQVPFAPQPVSFSSPARTVTFDEVTRLRDAQVAIVDTAEGYVVEATIPVKALTTSLFWPGRVLQGDAGIIVADATGRRVARLYRFNQQTQVVSDVPTEAALTPALWGELEVDK
ncbi:MAG TPA: FlgD immunoglobulin-like domain containing protein [Armatimonadota bacterium]|jgi:hypothetical protein